MFETICRKIFFFTTYNTGRLIIHRDSFYGKFALYFHRMLTVKHVRDKTRALTTMGNIRGVQGQLS